MRKLYFALLAVILGIVTVFTVGCSREKGSKIVIKGSTTVLPITQKASEEFMRETKIAVSVDGSGSGNGIKALIDGTCSIANSSRELKQEEINAIKAKGWEAETVAVAYDMVVPVIHPANNIKNLTAAQLKGIYDGSITDWKTVGGKSGNIVVISRDTSSGTYEIWHEKVQKKSDTRKDALLQASNGAILTAVAGNPKAIGYVGFGYVNSSVKTVTIDGIEPTIENGKSGKFPVSRKLYMFINKSSYSDNAKKFVDYLLSAKGQEIVKQAGFIPVK